MLSLRTRYPDYLYSLERIHAYTVLDQEPKATDDGVPPAYWPSSGELHVENLSAKYSKVGYSPILYPLISFNACTLGLAGNPSQPQLYREIWGAHRDRRQDGCGQVVDYGRAVSACGVGGWFDYD